VTLAWGCSHCHRERDEGQPHVCKATKEHLAAPRCTCVRPQLILEGDATETCPNCHGVRHAGSNEKVSLKSATLDGLASRLEDAVGAVQEQAAPGHLLCTAALEVAEALRVLSATVPPGAPPAALEAPTPETSPADREVLLLPPSIEQVARAILGAKLGARAGGTVAEWLEIRAKAFAAELKSGQDVDVLRRMCGEAFAAGQSAVSAWLLQRLNEKCQGARKRERRLLKELRQLVERKG